MNYDRVILELIDRVSLLEDEMEYLKSKVEKEDSENGDIYGSSSDSSGRDTTKYILDGKKYGKNRLVLAVVKKYMDENPNTSTNKLKSVFDKSLQGSLGVVRELEDVKNSYSDYERRFFVSPNEIINTTDGECVVCTQWGIGNIGNIIVRSKQLGIEVTIVE
jgi:hypothetical protein